MILAKVVGTVVTGKISDWIADPSLLLVQEIKTNGEKNGTTLVALDPIGARSGEHVLVSQGSSVRQTDETRDRPVDALIAGIVDIIEHEGKIVYRKDEQP